MAENKKNGFLAKLDLISTNHEIKTVSCTMCCRMRKKLLHCASYVVSTKSLSQDKTFPIDVYTCLWNKDVPQVRSIRKTIL